MSEAKNSILSDPTPYVVPEPQAPAKRPTQSDWDKLGKSRKYKEIDTYMLAREEYWRHFLPDGTAFKELAAKDPAQAGTWGGAASVIIDELDTLRYMLNQPEHRRPNANT